MDISLKIQKQREYFLSGATQSVAFRINALKKLRTAIIKNQSVLESALAEDFNKTPFETYMCEIGIVLQEISYFIKKMSSLTRIRRVRTPLSHFPAKSYMMYEPYGVALIMSPWNYPLQLSLLPLIGAIAAGNCVTLKPSAYTLKTSEVINGLISDVFDEEYVFCVLGGREENKALLEQKFDYIFFTGSVAVGKTVMAAAAKSLTPVTLELGGKSPVIVDESADAALAAKRVAFGKVLNAGQTCVAPDYAFIHESKMNEFISEFKTAVKKFFPENMNDMPSIVNEKQFKRVVSLLDGENVIFGGKIDETKRFIEPTLVTGCDLDSPLLNEEIFAPILPIISYKEIDDIIKNINKRPKPLALYLFTNDKKTEKKILSSCSFGGGCINDTIMHVANPFLSFGGVGESGMGSYHRKRSFVTFSHEKSILKKGKYIDPAVRYHPYSEKKLKLIRFLLK